MTYDSPPRSCDSCLNPRSKFAGYPGATRPQSPVPRDLAPSWMRGGWGWAQRRRPLYSRGQRTDVLVATERQADCGKGSTLVEHFCHLGGQVAGGRHEHLPEVAGPGGGLLLRPGRRKRCQTYKAGPFTENDHVPVSPRQGSAPKLKRNFPDFREEGAQEAMTSRDPGDITERVLRGALRPLPSGHLR